MVSKKNMIVGCLLLVSQHAVVLHGHSSRFTTQQARQKVMQLYVNCAKNIVKKTLQGVAGAGTYLTGVIALDKMGIKEISRVHY